MAEMFAPPLPGTSAALLTSAASCFEGWCVGADGAPTDALCLASEAGGLRIVASASVAGLMVRRPFAGPVASRGASIRLSLSVSTNDARALKRSLVNLSISGSIAGRRRTLASLHASSFETTRDERLLVTMEATWASRATDCLVELRFRRQAIDCLLKDIAWTVETIPRRGSASGAGTIRSVAHLAAPASPDVPTSALAVWTEKSAEGVGPQPVVRRDDTGLVADFSGTRRPLILERTLPLPERLGGTMLRIDVRLRGSDVDTCQALLSQIAIGVTAEDTKPRSLIRVSPSMAYTSGPRELRFVIEASCLGEKTLCTLELTFHGDEGRLSLEEIEVVLSRSNGHRTKAERAAAAPLSGAPVRPAATRVAVMGWQLADNAVGRAYLLADMLRFRYPTEIVGPLFGPGGAGVWEPLVGAPLPMRTFAGAAMRAFLADAKAFAAEVSCDIAYVSKPRLPAILLALLVHHRTGCGLVLDIDDHELSFFPGSAPVAIEDAAKRVAERRLAAVPVAGPLADPVDNPAESDGDAPDSLAPSALADEDRPDGCLWTAVAETLIPTFEDRTVSNPALRDRFGGLVVRHARDETVFRPDAAVRARIRQEFEIDDGDRCILFVGTPRRHKGLERLAAALHRVNDQRLRLIVVGTIADRGLQRDLTAFSQARISLFPNQPWHRLPELGHLADGVCLLQDPDSPIARYQIPAKLTDALALGVPVATTRVAPLADAPDPAAVTFVDDDGALDDWLRTIAAGSSNPAAAEGRIAWFEEELSYRVNRVRMELSLERAVGRPRVWNPQWSALFSALNTCYDAGLPEGPPDWASGPTIGTGVPAPAIHTGLALDIVCFWKQNDTGLYGRRHDMVMKYLRESERVRSLTVFDAPIRADALQKAAQRGRTASLDHAKVTSDATLRRFLELDDERDVRRRVFVYADKPGQTLFGRSLDTLEGYAEFVTQHMPRSAGGRRLAWAWPVAPHFAEIAGTVGFEGIVADLVDDERSMAGDPGRRDALSAEYLRTLASADTIFANCESLRDRFPAFRDAIQVVPNGCEILGEAPGGPPKDIASFAGPIIGYVGNLRSRIDVPLIERLARSHPQWNIVLVGSAHGNPDVLRLRGLPNVHFTGPRPYEEALGYVRRFDVAIMPHLRNDLTDSMNPLKLYVYVALGKRVVSTSVGNIEELRDHVDIAADHPDFLAKVEQAVARARFEGTNRPLSREALWAISWPRRVATMLAAIA